MSILGRGNRIIQWRTIPINRLSWINESLETLLKTQKTYEADNKVSNNETSRSHQILNNINPASKFYYVFSMPLSYG